MHPSSEVESHFYIIVGNLYHGFENTTGFHNHICGISIYSTLRSSLVITLCCWHPKDGNWNSTPQTKLSDIHSQALQHHPLSPPEEVWLLWKSVMENCTWRHNSVLHWIWLPTIQQGLPWGCICTGHSSRVIFQGYIPCLYSMPVLHPFIITATEFGLWSCYLLSCPALSQCFHNAKHCRKQRQSRKYSWSQFWPVAPA